MDAVAKRERMEKDLAIVKIGLGATKRVGSDAYPYYIADKYVTKNGRYVVGMYEADAHFERDWTEGTQKVDPFDPKKRPEFYICAWRNSWYLSDMNGNLLEPHRKEFFSFGAAVAYQDPSF